MYKEETYPGPIFTEAWIVVRTDIEPSPESRIKRADVFVAYDRNLRPHVYLTEEQAKRVAAQMRIGEPGRTFDVRAARIFVRTEPANAYTWSATFAIAQ